eukprot:TRINITY_DN6934_c0_g1_i1.p1 TRINITY_DN6934_c0_g1~~TRINITY_DN6934_c0_g1_i1.p1  ORF type:complete len:435 (+),score=47.88 TRINITY_DN6934_c0_g1_i1:24-1307(+)
MLLLLAFLQLVPASFVPEQIHLSLHGDPDRLVVSWVSFETTPFLSLVEWGSSPESLTSSRTGRFLAYETDDEDCDENAIRSVHSADFDVREGETVFYRVSSNGEAWSEVFVTTGQPRGYPQQIALWGDMGVNSEISSAGQIALDAIEGKHFYAIHYGDTAYNMNDDCGRVGDTFLNTVQNYSTLLPVVYTNGNHESGPLRRYAEYIFRLADAQLELAEASGSPSNRYFMWRRGPATFFTVDPDAWVYPPVFPLAQPQYEWLDQALASVNRTESPWLIGVVHRAMYCTIDTGGECNREAETMRYGFGGSLYGLEELLLKYGVDLYFAGHTHHYERSWPVREGNPTQYDYTEPRAPIHIVSGIGGVNGYDAFSLPPAPWEAFRDLSYSVSYARLTFYSDDTALVEQLFAVNGTVLDSIVIKQSRHGPFV